MMKYIPILLILLAAASRAQPPRIDSLSVDEWSGTLYLHGDFGSNQGVVTCDNVTLPITSWSDSLIATSIPDTGRGSCGPVIVGARGYKSVSRIISLLSGKWWYEPKSISTNDGKQWTLISGTYSLVFSFRFDLRPIIVGNSDVILNIHPKRQTLLEIIFLGGVYAGGGNGTQWFNDPGAPDSTRLPLVRTDSTVAAGFHTRFLLKSSKKIIEVTISDVNGIFLRSLRYDNYNQTANKIYSVKINDFSFVVPLDSDLSIKTISNYNDTLFSQTTNIIGTGFQFGLDTILSLGSSPTLASPANDSIFDGFNSWHPLKFMTKYRIQLADSQSMNFPIMDTILADTLVEYGIKSGEYFWRVAGINSEGQSKWSDVWKFKTPAPVLLSPPNDTVFAGTRYMTLQWDTLKSMDKYILQYSTDSTFHPANTLDSISSTMWLLSNLKLQTTYYWHVAGINSEGQSRWSDTWHFTTSVSSNVPQKNSEHAQLHCYPNPAANILNISLPASPENSAWLVLYDLQGRVIKKENILGRSGLQWDVADISKGVYFLDYVSGSVSQVMSVGIAR